MMVIRVATICRLMACCSSYFLLWLSFPAAVGVAATESDIWCLKSLKDSLQDPFGSLSPTWNFTLTPPGFICSFTGIECWNPQEDRVLNLRLQDMGLQGQFPAGLANCTSLTAFDISNNHISGPIPSDIDAILPFVTSLDLSNNLFSGLIPFSIANCSFLNSLILDNNRLWGPIPNEIGTLMPRLTYLSVSNNSLTGPVPNFPTTLVVFHFGNNPGLCGYPLEACNSTHHNNRPPFFHGFMTGWAVSMSFVFLVCLFAVPEIDVKKVTRWVNKQKRRPQTNPGNRLQPNGTETNDNRMISKMKRYTVRFNFAELSHATGNFSQDNVIGFGKMGKMYRATIRDTLFLAVKWIFNSEHLERQIALEVLTLGRYKNRSLVPLIGFCLEKNHTLLVYKYMSNGNLYDWLHRHPRHGKGAMMGYWPLRFKIAVKIAEGVAWLHHNSNLTVIHGALSSRCILLDKNFEPKISNFWESKIINSSSSILRRRDYGKKDVYLFGLMLLELITGKEPQELARSIRNLISPTPTSLLAYLSSVLNLDGTLTTREGFGDKMFQCLQLATNCLRSNPSQRPSMVQVHETLTAVARMNN